MPVKYCCVVGCTSDSRKHAKHGKYPWMKDVKFFSLPKRDSIRNKTMYRRWVKMINRKDWEPTSYSCVCSRHFVDKEPTSANPVPTLLMTPVSKTTCSPKKRSRAYRSLNLPGSSSGPIKTDIPNIDLVDENLDGDATDLALNSDNIVNDQKVEDTAVIFVTQDNVNEVEVSTQDLQKTGPSIGEMSVLIRSASPAAEHDYAHKSPVKAVRTKEVAIQTDVSKVQFEEMEREASRLKDKPKLRRELFIEHILKDDATINKFTGVRSRSFLDGLFCMLVGCVTKMKYWKGPGSAKKKNYEENPRNKPGPKRKLDPYTEFLLTLVRLRLGLPLFAMNAMFGVGKTVSSNVFTTWITLMAQTFMPLIKWPSRRKVQKHMPESFKKAFPSTRSIIDCTEFFTEKPNSPMAQSTTYSTYKSHNTAKLLVGITPSGAFHFLSKLYGGNTSDRYITKDSGYLDKVEPGDGIMADRGFTIQDLLLEKRAKLIIPPFTHKVTVGKGKRLTPKQIRHTQNVARLRIHVERAIGRIKNFRLIGNVIPMSLKYVTEQMITVSAFLCNLMSPLVKK